MHSPLRHLLVLCSCVYQQLRNDASGGIIVDTKEPGLKQLRAELTARTLSPEMLQPVEVPDTPNPASPRRHLQGTGIPHPPPTAVLPPPTVRFAPADSLQTTANRLWTAHPSRLPATVERTYRPPHYTTNQEHFEYLVEEKDGVDPIHFNKKNEMTEYLRSAIRGKVNLKATGHY